jgi:type IV pilus assembly protein PilC
MVVQMINVGEQTGGLDEMLSKIADFYDEEVDAAVRPSWPPWSPS